ACKNAIVEVYVDTYDRIPTVREINAWQSNLRDNGWSIAGMRAAFVENDQCKAAIVSAYQDLCSRPATDAEISQWRVSLSANASIAAIRAQLKAGGCK